MRTIIERVAMTRLNCVIGSASSMRAVVVQAVHHATHRSAFGGPLVDKPLMRNVLVEASSVMGVMGVMTAVCRDPVPSGRLAP